MARSNKSFQHAVGLSRPRVLFLMLVCICSMLPVLLLGAQVLSLALFAAINLAAFIILELLQRRTRKRFGAFLSLCNNHNLQLLRLFDTLTTGFITLIAVWRAALTDRTLASAEETRKLERGLEDLSRKLKQILDELTGSPEHLNTALIRHENLSRIVETMSPLVSRLSEIGELILGHIHSLATMPSAASVVFSRIVFLLRSTEEFLGCLSTASAKAIDEATTAIFSRMEEIWSGNDSIIKNAESTMEQLMSTDNEESFGYVAGKSRELSDDYNNFRITLTRLRDSSEAFMERSHASMAEIRQATAQIVDISENIKLISINVRIEAAHLTDRNSGFKVLGTDITALADKTALFAQATDEVVEKTVDAVANQRFQFDRELEDVFVHLDRIRSTIAPFETILKTAYSRIHDVVGQLGNISNSLKGKMMELVSSLQFQDVSQQESTHRMQLFSRLVADLAQFCGAPIEVALPPEEQQALRQWLVDRFFEVCTTHAEASAASQKAQEWGCRTPDLSRFETGKTDNDTILFT